MQTESSIEALVRRKDAAATTFEYNCQLRRLYPWRPVAETKRQITEFGVIWVTLAGGEAVDPHDHDEEETFIVVSGAARLTIGSQSTEIAAGDVAYIPRFSRHRLENISATEPFVMIDVYWDWQGRASALDQPQPEGAAA